MKKIIYKIATISYCLLCSLPSESFSMDLYSKNQSNPVRSKFNSEESAAGIFLVAEGEDGKFYTLLGHRNDQNTWCNFGGKSDPEDQDFGDTAIREVFEESMGICRLTKQSLSQSAYTIISINSQNNSSVKNYCMFWAQIPMISAEIFKDRLEKQHEDHSKEYTDFRWFPIECLLQSVSNNSSHFDYDETKFELMADLFDSLKQKTSINILQGLSKGINQVLFVQPPESLTFEERFIKEFRNSMPIKKFRRRNDKVEQIPNKFNDENTQKVNKAFAGKTWDEIFSSSDCPSITFFKAFLGKKYETSSRNNIINFINICCQKYNKTINLDEKKIDILCKMLEREQAQYKEKHKFTLYHGCKGKILLLYKYWTAIYSIIMGEQMNEFGVIRTNDLIRLASDTGLPYGSIWEVMSLYQGSHYGKETEIICMFFNYFLGAGFEGGSFTMEYFLNGFSAYAPRCRDLIVEGFIPAGMTVENAEICYQEFESLWRMFFKPLNNNTGTGGMLSFSIPFELLNILANTHDEASLFESYLKIQELASLFGTRGPFDKLSDEDQRILLKYSNTGRLYLDPSIYFSMSGVFGDALPEKQKPLFEYYFNNAVFNAIKRLLYGKPIKKSFYLLSPERSIYKNFRKAYKKEYNCPPSLQKADALPFLLKRGLINVVEKLYPGLDWNDPQVLDKLKEGIIVNAHTEEIDVYKNKTQKSIWKNLSMGEAYLILNVVIEDLVKKSDQEHLKSILDEISNPEFVSFVLHDIMSRKNQLYPLILPYEESQPGFWPFIPANIRESLFKIFLFEGNYEMVYHILRHEPELHNEQVSQGFMQILCSNIPGDELSEQKMYWDWGFNELVNKLYSLSDDKKLNLKEQYTNSGRCGVERKSIKHLREFDQYLSDDLKKLLLKKFKKETGRPYSLEMLNDIIQMLEIASYPRIKIQPIHGHRWLDALKQVKTVQQFFTLMNELDDVSVLFQNLNVLDAIFLNLSLDAIFLNLSDDPESNVIKNENMSLFDFSIYDEAEIHKFTDKFLKFWIERSIKYGQESIIAGKNSDFNKLPLFVIAPNFPKLSQNTSDDISLSIYERLLKYDPYVLERGNYSAFNKGAFISLCLRKNRDLDQFDEEILKSLFLSDFNSHIISYLYQAEQNKKYAKVITNCLNEFWPYFLKLNLINQFYIIGYDSKFENTVLQNKIKEKGYWNGSVFKGIDLSRKGVLETTLKYYPADAEVKRVIDLYQLNK